MNERETEREHQKFCTDEELVDDESMMDERESKNQGLIGRIWARKGVMSAKQRMLSDVGLVPKAVNGVSSRALGSMN